MYKDIINKITDWIGFEDGLEDNQKTSIKNINQLIEAIITVESSGNPGATRHEPGYQYVNLELPRHPTMDRETERRFQQTSWGLMQIMGATARHLGFRGDAKELMDPEVNIRYGTMYLKNLWERYLLRHGVGGVIAAYNAGRPSYDEKGNYKNSKYVKAVKKALSLIQAQESSIPPTDPGAPEGLELDGNTTSHGTPNPDPGINPGANGGIESGHGTGVETETQPGTGGENPPN